MYGILTSECVRAWIGLYSGQVHRDSDKINVYDGSLLTQWYSTFFVRLPPDIISLQLCTPKVVAT
jgi:hypothetical protein